MMESAAGVKLDRFFRQWLERGGFPFVAGSWKYDPAAHVVSIDLNQVQADAPYQLPLEVGLDTGAPEGLFVSRLNLTERRQRFEVQAVQKPRRVYLDPNFWVLMDKEFHENE